MNINYDGKEFLKRLREVSNGKTQEEIAEIIHIDKSTVSRWNNTQPKTENLIALANAFDCSIDYLLGFSEDDKKTTDNFSLFELIRHIIYYDLKDDKSHKISFDFSTLYHPEKDITTENVSISIIPNLIEKYGNRICDLFYEYNQMKPGFNYFTDLQIKDVIEGLLERYRHDLLDLADFKSDYSFCVGKTAN